MPTQATEQQQADYMAAVRAWRAAALAEVDATCGDLEARCCGGSAEETATAARDVAAEAWRRVGMLSREMQINIHGVTP